LVDPASGTRVLLLLGGWSAVVLLVILGSVLRFCLCSLRSMLWLCYFCTALHGVDASGSDGWLSSPHSGSGLAVLSGSQQCEVFH